tara:strand:+ start:3 stop:1340 length:1338 start_codon:yes stop_codon:yes gene_type:complete
MLNLRKQEAADRRKKDRKDGRKSSSVEANYEGISDPRLKLYMTQQARELSRFMGDNYDSEDPMILSEIEDRKNNLRLFTEYAKGLDTKISTYNPLNKDASNLRYQTDEDGNNMIDVNKQAIFASLQDGTFDLQSRIASFEDDFDGQVIQDETTPGYMGFLKDMESESFIGADGNTYKGLDPGEKTQFLNRFKKNHLINPNTNNFVSTQAEKDYMTNERFEIDGNVYDGIGAYLLEEEGINNEPSPEERERFNPKSEFFDEKLHTDYVNYLGEKIWSRETANRNTLLTRVKPEEGDDKNKLSQDRIDFFGGDSVETLPYGEALLKTDPGFLDDVSEQGILASLNETSVINEMGDAKIKEFRELLQVANSDETDVAAEGKVKYIGITTSGKPVASVEFSGQTYLIDLADISTQRSKVKSGNTTALDLFKLSDGMSTKSSDWKTSWKK